MDDKLVKILKDAMCGIKCPVYIYEMNCAIPSCTATERCQKFNNIAQSLNRHYYNKVMRRLVKVRKKYNDGSWAYRALGEMQDEIEDSFLQTDATKKNSG